MSQVVLIVILCTVLAVRADFPDDPKPCKYGDSKCIVKLINELISEKATRGAPDFNLMKLDPLPVPTTNVKQGEDSPVNIDLTFKDNKVHGISTMKIRKVKFRQGYDTKARNTIKCGSYIMVGPYIIKGKVLILPINGDGLSNLTLVNCDIALSFTGKPFEKNGETHMEIANLRLTTKPERLYYHFSNLYNGDKALGDNMNAFLNDNWEAIFLEVRQSMELAFAEIFRTIITSVFSKNPYAKFFEE
ncbi:protein takeout isoform X3 [Drosophila virilis]|nr:protein takeout isoform X1 [Drosophila virilis]